MVRRINLVPATERRRTNTDFGLIGLVAGALLVVGAIGVSYLYFTGVASDREAELAELQTQRQQIEAQLTQLAKYEALQQEVVRTENLVQSVYAGRTLVSSVLGDVSLVIPDNVWFETMSLTAPEIQPPATPTPAPSAAPGAPDTGAAVEQAEGAAAAPAAAPATAAPPALGVLTVTGKTYTYEDVATLLVRLQQVPSFTNVVLESATAEGDDSEGLKSFSIKAEVVNKTQAADTPLPLTEVEVSN